MDIADQIAALNPQEGERFSVNYITAPLVEGEEPGDMVSRVLPPHLIPEYVGTIPDHADIWIGVNPVGPSVKSGRGKAGDIIRLTSLFADLDVKENGCATYEVADAIIDDLSEILGEAPTFVVYSGHGIQPYWAIDPDENLPNAELGALLKRWKKLIGTVAKIRGAQVDSVFDLARILRIVMTLNNKERPGGDPIDVQGEMRSGGPMTLAQIDERFCEADVYADGLDIEEVTEVSDPNGWTFTDSPHCGYSLTLVEEWKKDYPDEGRHYWHYGQTVRWECLRRKGCLTREQYLHGLNVIEARYREMCASGIGGDPRSVSSYGIEGDRRDAIVAAAGKSEREISKETGGHNHDDWMSASAGSSVPPTGQPGAGNAPSNVVPLRPIPGTGGQSTAPAAAPDYGMTETANAVALVRRSRDHLRYCPQTKRWLNWTGEKWSEDPDDSAAAKVARDVADALPQFDQASISFRKRSLSKSSIMGVIELAKRDRDLQVSRDVLDANPYDLNTPTGIVDLRTGSLRPHDQYAWCTKMTGVEFPRGAWPHGKRWHAFLHDTFGGKAELIDYMQQLFGYSALGEVTHHILPFLYGVGANGKSVMLEVIRRILGTYAAVATGKFLVSGGREHESEIVKLVGARMVVCSEVNEDSKFDEEKVKRLTGGDGLDGRYLYGQSFDFTPSHTLFLAANHQPAVRSGGMSMWRRLRLIPFDHVVPEDKRNERLAEELVEQEGPAILAWIVAGAKRVVESGLQEPDSVKAATDEYAATEDVLGQFLAECVVDVSAGTSGRETSGAVYQRYSRWCLANGIDPKSGGVFGRELSARLGRKPFQTNGKRYVTGIMLVEEPVDTDYWKK
jgi:P4 family phage/plasmid primase-like protien